MIKDPMPFLWSCPDDDDRHKRIICPYSERYNLPCGTQRTECKGCLMFQLQLGDHYNKLYKDKKVTHICDRCGKELNRIDLAVYLDISNRAGVTMLAQELCYDCAAELIEWAQEYDKPQ